MGARRGLRKRLIVGSTLYPESCFSAGRLCTIPAIVRTKPNHKHSATRAVSTISTGSPRAYDGNEDSGSAPSAASAAAASVTARSPIASRRPRGPGHLAAAGSPLPIQQLVVAELEEVPPEWAATWGPTGRRKSVRNPCLARTGCSNPRHCRRDEHDGRSSDSLSAPCDTTRNE